MSNMKLKVSASRVGEHFNHGCARFSAFSVMEHPEYIGWGKHSHEQTASQEAGRIWEREVLGIINAGGLTCEYKWNDAEKKYEDLSEEETVAALHAADKDYIYQATISMPDSFLREVILANEENREKLAGIFSKENAKLSATWSICKPDLIRVEHDADGTPVFSVIDIKHAKHAKMHHKVQVAIYVKLLSALMKDKGIPGRVNTEVAYLWNFKKEEPTAFDLTKVMPFTDRYFNSELPRLIEKVDQCVSQTDADAYNKAFPAAPGIQCEWCDNFEQCLAWQQAHEPVTLMPYMSGYAQRYLRAHKIPLTMDAFTEYIADEENRTALSENCLSLKRILKTADINLRTLREKLAGEEGALPEVMTASSMEMPKGQSVRFILTAQRDEATDRGYAFGILAAVSQNNLNLFDTEMVEAKGGNRHAKDYEKVFLAETKEDLNSVTREFFETLYSLLEKCDTYNTAHEAWEEQLSVQAYVMDNYERMNLEDLLFDDLLADDTEEEYRQKLLRIMYWLQGERMVTDTEEAPGQLEVEFPVVVLTNAVKKLFALPAFIAYDLETISKAFIEDNEFYYKKISKYAHRISNTMKSDPINNVWAGKTDDAEKELNAIRMHIHKRLITESRVVREIQTRLSGDLHRYPVKFKLQGSSTGRDPRAAKLLIENVYEELLKYQEARRVRMEDLSVMAEEGQIMRLAREEEIPVGLKYFPPFGRPDTIPGYRCKFRLLNADRFFKGEMFSGILLSAADEQAAAKLRSITKKVEEDILPQVVGNMDDDRRILNLFVAQNMSLAVEGDQTYVEFERYAVCDANGNPIPLPDGEYYIVERYKDFNSSKTENVLNNDSLVCMNQNQGEDLDVRTYLYPERIYKTIEEDFDENCLNFMPQDGKNFTASQLRAFRHMFQKNITLLLGPPGSGKTDFIARAVLTLCAYYKDRGRALTVAVSANSNSAINNMLSAIAEKKDDVRNEPLLYRLEKWGDAGEQDIPGVRLCKGFVERGSSEINTRNIFSNTRQSYVIGTSCWQTMKALDGYKKFVDGNYNNIGAQDFAGYDIVVIDEASQMRNMDALLVLQSSLDNPNTRFLIVGDENQLPPIIQGKYDASEQGINFYGSVFRAFYDAAKVHGLDYLMPLEEQFRMNEVLSRYCAQEIYDTDMKPGDGRNGYHSFDFGKENPKLSVQKLQLAEVPADVTFENEKEILDFMMDPEYPLVVCNLKGGEPGDKREREISLVSDLVKYMRGAMCNPETGTPYASDRTFWGFAAGDGGLGIVSPHHEQINRLKDHISEETDMARDELYIGTVDKLQGKQREAVIVSYGMTDPERAAGELEFIYSRNRLNVSLTRGKKKMICFLTDTLTEYGTELLNVDDEDILKGISFMTQLLTFMETEEADTECVSRTWECGDISFTVYKKRVK